MPLWQYSAIISQHFNVAEGIPRFALVTWWIGHQLAEKLEQVEVDLNRTNGIHDIEVALPNSR
jgi:hypothetical protein